MRTRLQLLDSRSEEMGERGDKIKVWVKWVLNLIRGE